MAMSGSELYGASVRAPTLVPLLTSVTATAVGAVKALSVPCSIQIWIAGTSGAISATTKIWVSNDVTCLTSQTNAAKTLLATSILSGTGAGAGVAVSTDAWTAAMPWKYWWGEVSAISGTGAAVTATGAYL